MVLSDVEKGIGKGRSLRRTVNDNIGDAVRKIRCYEKGLIGVRSYRDGPRGCNGAARGVDTCGYRQGKNFRGRKKQSEKDCPENEIFFMYFH